MATLLHLFESGVVNCLLALDSNNDSMVDIADVVYTLGYLFEGGRPPDAPFPDCGTGTAKLPCDSFDLCN